MLKVTSFLKIDNSFIPIVGFTGEIIDPDYIEGAIEIRLNEKHLLDLSAWDYVDQIWAYLVDGLTEVASGREFSTYFPDQPIQVIFQPDQHCKQVNIVVKFEKVTLHDFVEYEEFMEVMVSAGKFFFHRMAQIVPESQDFYRNAEQKLSTINWR